VFGSGSGDATGGVRIADDLRKAAVSRCLALRHAVAGSGLPDRSIGCCGFEPTGEIIDEEVEARLRIGI